MNVSSTTVVTRELKPLEAPFLPIDDLSIQKVRETKIVHIITNLKRT